MKKNKKDEERDLNWENFVSTIILVPRLSTVILVPHATSPCWRVSKKGQISVFVDLTVKINGLD
jgi:hypothetical protein